jgi:hypothetical protein
MSDQFKAGDVYVQDAGDGTRMVKIITGPWSCVSLHITGDGKLYSVCPDDTIYFHDGWPTAKYGEPVSASVDGGTVTLLDSEWNPSKPTPTPVAIVDGSEVFF